MRVVTVEERAHLARCTPTAFEEAWDALRKQAAEVPLPCSLATFRGLMDPLVLKVGRLLANLLFERLRDLLHVEEAGGGEGRVVGFGATQAAAIPALLRASPVPMRVEDVAARFGKNMPEEVLYFDRGLVGLEHHFPDFPVRMANVVPAVGRVGGARDGRGKSESL